MVEPFALAADLRRDVKEILKTAKEIVKLMKKSGPLLREFNKSLKEFTKTCNEFQHTLNGLINQMKATNESIREVSTLMKVLGPPRKKSK